MRSVWKAPKDHLQGIVTLCLNFFVYTDTKEERNALMQHVYPKLAEFCREKHGLEFPGKYMWGLKAKTCLMALADPGGAAGARPP